MFLQLNVNQATDHCAAMHVKGWLFCWLSKHGSSTEFTQQLISSMRSTPTYDMIRDSEDVFFSLIFTAGDSKTTVVLGCNPSSPRAMSVFKQTLQWANPSGLSIEIAPNRTDYDEQTRHLLAELGVSPVHPGSLQMVEIPPKPPKPTAVVLLFARDTPSPSNLVISAVFSSIPPGCENYLDIANSLSSQFKEPGRGLDATDIFLLLVRHREEAGKNPLVFCVRYHYSRAWPPDDAFLMSALLKACKEQAIGTEEGILKNAWSESVTNKEGRDIAIAGLPLQGRTSVEAEVPRPPATSSVADEPAEAKVKAAHRRPWWKFW